jgi:DNA-binding transcriptional ArsR family regulator
MDATETLEKADVFKIPDVPTLRAVADPLRMRLLMALDEGPLTVKELAARLDVPQTRLYYHVRMLEKFGLLVVASTRMVSGIEERRYAATAKSWDIADDLIDSPAVADVLKAMFDLARVELMLALAAEGPRPGERGSSVPILMSTKGYMTADEIQEFTTAMGDLIGKYTRLDGARRPDTQEYHATFAVYRAGMRSDAS